MSVFDVLYAAERERLAALENPARAGDYAHPVFGRGPKNPALMLIGEAPGREEAQTGTPFVGKAGKQLDELLELAGIDRRDVFVTNAVKFRPVHIKPRGASNRTPQRSEVLASLPLLGAEIALAAPRFIATLGNTPLFAIAALSGLKPTVVGTVHGQPQTVAINAARYTLFPLYHPASGIYNRELIRIMKEDLLRLGAFVREANRT